MPTTSTGTFQNTPNFWNSLDKVRHSQIVASDERFPGQYYDAETGHNYNYYRDYDARTGRYEESDPSGLNGGLNTFAYAHSASTIVADPTGLLGWHVAAESPSITEDLVTGGLYPTVPGLPAMGFPLRGLGTTTVSWQINSECDCLGNNQFEFEGYDVNISFTVHLRANYPDGAAESRWVVSKEMNHVDDFVSWANGPGKAVATTNENEYVGLIFGDMNTCISRTKNVLTQALQSSLKLAVYASVAKWDDSHLHDYPGTP